MCLAFYLVHFALFCTILTWTNTDQTRQNVIKLHMNNKFNCLRVVSNQTFGGRHYGITTPLKEQTGGEEKQSEGKEAAAFYVDGRALRHIWS